MAEEVKEVKEKKKKELPIAQVTTCKSTQQMLRKAAEDGVEDRHAPGGRHEGLPHWRGLCLL
jgi:hypothetical protein